MSTLCTAMKFKAVILTLSERLLRTYCDKNSIFRSEKRQRDKRNQTTRAARDSSNSILTMRCVIHEPGPLNFVFVPNDQVMKSYINTGPLQTQELQ